MEATGELMSIAAHLPNTRLLIFSYWQSYSPPARRRFSVQTSELSDMPAAERYEQSNFTASAIGNLLYWAPISY